MAKVKAKGSVKTTTVNSPDGSVLEVRRWHFDAKGNETYYRTTGKYTTFARWTQYDAKGRVYLYYTSSGYTHGKKKNK